MEALSRPAASANSIAQATPAAGRALAPPPAEDKDSRAAKRTLSSAGPLRRANYTNQGLQGEVARAQQAIDYLERVAAQLEALKADLSARISGRTAASRQLEGRTRQLSATLDARQKEGGAGLDAQLDFDGVQGAQQRFKIQGLDIASLTSGGTQTLGFSVGSAGGPQLAATIEPGMTPEDIARRLDRTLAPVKVRAGLDQERELVFTTPEASFAKVKDAIAVTGRGRVDTTALPASLQPKEWELGNPDALRESLREVVQALARVRRSQDAAALALSAAMARNAVPDIPSAELAMIAEDFAGTAASHDYASLLAITSALVGVSRDRVQALLGLR